MATSTASSSGIGLGGAAFLVLMTLKLTGYITWSWWWVTAPLWGPAGIALVIVMFALCMTVIVGQMDRHKFRRRY